MSYDLAGWLLVASAGATVLLMVTIALVRAITTVAASRRARAHAGALPLLLDITDGVDVPLPPKKKDAHALGTGAATLAHKVRGADRADLASWLRRNGFREDALRGMRAWRPSRRAAAVELYLALDDDPTPIRPLVSDRHPRVRTVAVRALGEAGVVDAIPVIVEAAVAPRGVSTSTAAMAIVQAGPSSAHSFGPIWQSHDPRARRLAVDVCGHLGLADARAHLERALSATDGALRTRAALALGRVGSPHSVPALEAALVPVVRGSAEERALLDALSALGSPREIP
ncbi:HEAT repeat domain-containing protein [Sanguibacter sp. A247]|uniref:HEAT repeat domain-containing protein n=1 Tax=unclassified Sanguibacter TaxID=2645534 RepID=UPI003FD7D047